MPRPTPPQTHTVDEQTGCWIWNGGRNSLGYGRIAGPLRTYAHRVYYERFKGPIPHGLDIDHLCRVPTCVNPDHLEAVPHAVNIRRGTLGKMTVEQLEEARSRFAAGSMLVRDLAREYSISESQMSRNLGPVRKGPLTKLSAQQASAIRERYAAGDISTRALGREFGVSSTTVSSIARGLRWN